MRMRWTAPVRIDLAGGWTDLAPYTHDYGGEVINIAIDMYGWYEDGEEGCTAPRGSGLGTSSSVISARLASTGLSGVELAESAHQEERKGGAKCGRQDQWAAVFGGVQHLVFTGEEVSRTAIDADCSWLEEKLILADTGIIHNSSDQQDLVWPRYPEITSFLHSIKSATRKLSTSLENPEIVAQCFNQVSAAVDGLHPSINVPYRPFCDELIESGIASGWKGMGAGGGGVVGILANEPQQVINAITQNGWTYLPWSIDYDGVRALVD